MTASPNGCNSETDLEYGVPIYPGGLTLRLTVISTLDVPFIVGAKKKIKNAFSMKFQMFDLMVIFFKQPQKEA
jgi:hypothetical protein